MIPVDDNTGAHSFEYVSPYPCRLGRVRNICSFEIMAGDNPDIEKAKRLMPGAHYAGIIHGIIPFWELGIDSGYLSLGYARGRWYECCLSAGDSVFTTYIYTYENEIIQKKLDAIGGLKAVAYRDGDEWVTREAGPLELPKLKQLRLYARYYWNRRPVLRFRTPVDI